MAHRRLASGLPALAGLALACHAAADTVPPAGMLVETVPNSYCFVSAPTCDTGPEIVVTSQGVPVIVGKNHPNSAGLFTRGPTGWSCDEFAYGSDTAPYEQHLAIGPDDGIHAAWGQSLYQRIYHAARRATWDEYDGVIAFGAQIQAAVDGAGHPALVYGSPLTYGIKAESGWGFEPVATEGMQAGRSLAFDSLLRPWISYGDAVAHDLLMTHKDAGAWIPELVDSAGDVGNENSLALDAQDRPHIVYWDATNARLKYARLDGSQWQIEAIPTGADTPGPHASLQLDASGDVHVVYYNATRGDLEYAVRRSGRWYGAALDTLGDVGQVPSLFIDGTGQLHVAYADRANQRIKYARRYLAVDVGSGRPRAGASLGVPAPNPVRGGIAAFSLRFEDTGAAALRVYDLRGRLVASRSLGDLPGGEHRLRWDTGIRAPGLYFVRLETPAGVTPARRWVVAP